MSYDIWMTIDTGGPEPACVHAVGNHTSNTSIMWRKVMPETDGLAGIDGKKGADVLASLRAGYSAMVDRAAEMRAMNPANGWGSYESARAYLLAVVRAAESHPLAEFRVCR